MLPRVFVLVVLLLFSVISALLAQDGVEVISQDISNGFHLALNTTALSPQATFLAVQDSAGEELILTNLRLGDQAVWLKKGTGASDTVLANTANWFYDQTTRSLYVDLAGIRESLAGSATLHLTVSPVKTFQSSFSVSVFQTPANVRDLPGDLQRIADLRINLE